MGDYGRLGISFYLCIAAAFLGLLSSLLCIASEFKRTKNQELKLDGKLCYLPGSSAFKYGVGALVLLCSAQTIGSFGIVRLRASRTGKKTRSRITTGLLVVSWISFIIAVALLSTATSMSREQRYGEGWLNGECYLVKGGVYIGSATLAFVVTCCILCSAFLLRIGSDRQGGQDHLEEHRALER